MKPSISIVVPAFDSGRFLAETLRSIQAQSVTDWECVVVDDGSTDDTLGIARSFETEDVRFRVLTVTNGGASAARNTGFLATDRATSFVSFMDSDDVWLPDALAVLLDGLEVDAAAIGAHALAERIDEHGHAVTTWSHASFGRDRWGLEGRRLVRWPLDRPTTFDVLVNGNVLFPPGLLLVRREAYERAGRFDEVLTGAEDWDMLIRLSRQGHLSFVEQVILHYRLHGSNLGAAPGIERQAWEVRCKGFHSPENDAVQRRAARRGWKAYQRHMIGVRWRETRSALRSGRPGEAADRLARIVVHLGRWLRGSPRPKVVRRSVPW